MGCARAPIQATTHVTLAVAVSRWVRVTRVLVCGEGTTRALRLILVRRLLSVSWFAACLRTHHRSRRISLELLRKVRRSGRGYMALQRRYVCPVRLVL